MLGGSEVAMVVLRQLTHALGSNEVAEIYLRYVRRD
jgi:hypothetical protein